MKYELVLFEDVRSMLVSGWEPAPGLETVYRYVNQRVTQTYVWMRKEDGPGD